MSVTNEETFLYQPFGDIDVVTKIIASMSLKLMKLHMVNPRKHIYLFTFYTSAYTHTHTHLLR